MCRRSRLPVPRLWSRPWRTNDEELLYKRLGMRAWLYQKNSEGSRWCWMGCVVSVWCITCALRTVWWEEIFASHYHTQSPLLLPSTDYWAPPRSLKQARRRPFLVGSFRARYHTAQSHGKQNLHNSQCVRECVKAKPQRYNAKKMDILASHRVLFDMTESALRITDGLAISCQILSFGQSTIPWPFAILFVCIGGNWRTVDTCHCWFSWQLKLRSVRKGSCTGYVYSSSKTKDL